VLVDRQTDRIVGAHIDPGQEMPPVRRLTAILAADLAG